MFRRILITWFMFSVALLAGGLFYFPLFLVGVLVFLLGVTVINLVKHEQRRRQGAVDEAFANRYRLDPP